MHLMNNEENHFFGVYDNDKYYVNKRTSKKPNNNNNKSKGTSKSTSKPSGGGSKSTTSSSNGYKPSSGATPTSIKNADNRKTGYKPADSGYQYLRTAKAKILNKKGHYTDGGIGHNFKRKLAYDEFDLYNDINIRGKNIKANDLYSFVNSISKHTPVYYEKGEKLYVVDSKTAGTLSVGPGIVLKYNNDYFKKYGLDVSNLREGATIPASIVDKVTNDILADKRKYVLNVLETNGIKGLSDNQIDALTSRAYSVGNISNFPSMYKQYSNTEELYKNYLSTVNGKDTIYEKELTERRNAEIELFKNGYSKKDISDSYYYDDSKPAQKIRDPLADYLDDLKSKGKDISDITDSSVIRDPLADYLDNLKAKGIDTSDITDSSKSPQERSHAAPSSYYNDGHSLIEFSEGHTPLSADGKSYMVDLDPGSGHPLAVGKGVLLKANETLFAQEGIDVNNYKAGDYLPVDVVDRVGMRIEENKRNEILKMAQDNNIVLTDYQVDALISRSYQFGNVDGFPAAYKAANGDVDTFINNYMLSGGGDSNRRQREADVFKNGYV